MSKMADFYEEDLGQIRNLRCEGDSWTWDTVERIRWDGEDDAIYGLVEPRMAARRGHFVSVVY